MCVFRISLLIVSTLIGTFIFSPECKAELVQIRDLKVKPAQVQSQLMTVTELKDSITKISLLIKQIEPDLNQSFKYEHRFYDNLESIDLHTVLDKVIRKSPVIKRSSDEYNSQYWMLASDQREFWPKAKIHRRRSHTHSVWF